MKKSIYELKLHEVTTDDYFNYEITRVPGGWLYSDLTGRPVTTFVPFNNEFQ